MRVGVIGCGHIGITHCAALRALAETTGLAVTALADLLPENLDKAAAYWPCAKRHARAKDLLRAGGLDAVHICLPGSLHAAVTLAAMARGIHVFVEKPLCLRESDCAALLNARIQYGVHAAVGHVVRFIPEYEYLKAACESGVYGALRAITMSRLCGRTANWYWDGAKSGTVVLDLHIHDCDFLRWILGEPQGLSVESACGKGASGKSGAVTHVSSRFDYAGVTACAEAVWDASPLPFEAAFRAHFENATLVYGSRQPIPLCVYSAKGKVLRPSCRTARKAALPPGVRHILPYYRELARFYDCLRENRSPSKISMEESAKSVRLALRVLKLAQAAQGKSDDSQQKREKIL